MLAVLSLAAAPGVHAATPAGASIANVATLTYRSGGVDYGTASNRVVTTVGEIVDFRVTPVGDLAVVAGANQQGVAFRLTNLGNGPHAFNLALDPGLLGDSFDPTACRIYVDHANQTTPDLASLQPYDPNTPLTLAAGEIVTVWAVCNIPPNAGGIGHIRLNVRPVANSGVPIWKPEDATGVDTYHVQGGLSAQLVKTQSVVDARGRPRAIKGATVTYRLTAALQGQGVAHDLTVSDPIPLGSTYVPGSLRLDDAALTDAADGDIGQVGAQGVLVRLGDVTAPTVRTVTFQVLINP